MVCVLELENQVYEWNIQVFYIRNDKRRCSISDNISCDGFGGMASKNLHGFQSTTENDGEYGYRWNCLFLRIKVYKV